MSLQSQVGVRLIEGGDCLRSQQQVLERSSMSLAMANSAWIVHRVPRRWRRASVVEQQQEHCRRQGADGRWLAHTTCRLLYRALHRMPSRQARRCCCQNVYDREERCLK